ncbi:MAG: hypothetical protein QNK05_02615 [Myxococcota bacterium]|nr:hypothetical protein [Myxococcota bacterium]
MSLFLGAAALLLLSAGAASASEPATWDQARVTQYAEELVAACSELDGSLAARPTYVTQVNQRAFYQARDDIRVMNSSAKRLLARLKDGEGRDETHPIYKRISLLRNSAAEEGRKAAIPEDIMAKATAVGGALLKIRPYYEGEPDVE